MIAFPQAIHLLRENRLSLSPQVVPLRACGGRVAAQDEFSPLSIPQVNTSAMDGYAFRFEDWQAHQTLTVSGIIQAGASALHPLPSAEAVRIFTGAPLPPNADTVVAQEDVFIHHGKLQLQKPATKGDHVRPKASQTQQGDLVLKKDTLLTSAHIGFLATLGFQELRVHPQPKVGIITTGKELVPIGSPLHPHQVYESNSVFLDVALQEVGITPSYAVWADDDPHLLKRLVQELAEQVDILLFTGGISVGDYDFVKPVLEELGVQEWFYKVKQKPGKPLFFGRLNETVIFALPGNPSAVVSCFHLYIKPYVLSCMGMPSFEKKTYGILQNSYSKKAGLTHIVKAYVHPNHHVEILPHQLSYQMDAYAKANAFAVLLEEQTHIASGEKIELVLFKY